MKKALFGFFGGIIFVITVFYKFMTRTEGIKMAFAQAWKAWFWYAIFGEEYVPSRRVRYYRPYSSYYRPRPDIDDNCVELNRRKTEEGKKNEY